MNYLPLPTGNLEPSSTVNICAEHNQTKRNRSFLKARLETVLTEVADVSIDIMLSEVATKISYRKVHIIGTRQI